MIRLLISLLTCALAVHACTLEEEFKSGPGLELNFSQDTVRFDTVFTEVGSATRSFKIFNPYSDPVSINSVRVSNDAGGKFRINVDGLAGDDIRDIFLPPDDSIYVFVEVTVDPDADLSVSPFIFEGEVIVEASDVEQVVKLEAFGQNAIYLPTDRQRANFGVLTCNFGEEIFDDPKPYVLYGSLIIDECTLRLPPGTRLYVHGGLVRNPDLFDEAAFNDGLIIVQGTGRLLIEGSAEEPVLIATDRLEERFADAGGQYSGIRLGPGTGPNRISHARIRNGIVGVFADSMSTLSIDHSEISYTSSAGIVGYQANVDMSNVLLHSNGGGALQAIKGGRYRVDYSTMVNYNGRNPAVAMTTGFDLTREVFIVANLDAEFRNSIIYGSLNDEFAVGDFGEQDLLNYSLSNCILRSTDVPVDRPEFSASCVDCLFPALGESLFVAPGLDSFQLDTLSVAQGFAEPLPGIDDDIWGRARDAAAPDCGAFEYQYD